MSGHPESKTRSVTCSKPGNPVGKLPEFDVVVAGGGPAGIGAAIGAARAGARTILVERHPILGGMGTVALVNNFCNAHYDGERLIIGGVFSTLRQRMIDRNAVHVTGGLEPFDHDIYRQEIERFLHEASVYVLPNAKIKGLDTADGFIQALKMENGTSIMGRTFVDATGDAHIADMGGVPFSKGEKNKGAVMPLTYCYILGPVDRRKLREHLPEAMRKDLRTNAEYIYLGGQPMLKEKVMQARRNGELTIPRDRIAVAYSMPGQPDHVSVNFGRVRVKNPTDETEMEHAEKEGLKQVEEGVHFFRKHVPGFENARVTELARQIGVRESRQIIGLYQLTGEDVLQGRQFPDVIAQGRYPIDIHNPHDDTTEMRSLAPGTHYDIPMRCLIPARGPGNLTVGGRSISATQEAMSSFRVSPSAMAIGEAAGVVAALASKGNRKVADVNYTEVRQSLLAGGAVLE